MRFPAGSVPACVFFSMAALYFTLALPAFGRSSAEEPPQMEPLNREWVLCVTAFDVSSFPPERRLIGELVGRNLVRSLNSVDRRVRVSREFAYYEDYARTQSRAEAARALAAKRDERDALFYRGNPRWKYRKDLRALEGEIAELEKAYRAAEALMPNITGEPLFRLSEDSSSAVFPPPPEAGEEFRFCTARQADAFLDGRISEYHGRIFVSIRLYTLYTRSFQYEDSVIFSPEDVHTGVDTLADRLRRVISGTPPAAVLVKTRPANALVLAGNTLVRGSPEAAEESEKTRIVERLPGPVELQVSAENHQYFSTELDLFAGELAEVYIDLKPIALAIFNVSHPQGLRASVYRGSRFAGFTPLTLRVPLGGKEYITLESPGGESASMVYRGFDGTVEFLPQPPREKQVERFRRKFYGAYGRFWVALPIAYLLSGVASAYTAASSYNSGVYDKAINYYYVSMAAAAVSGYMLAESFYRLYRYVNNAGEDVPRMAK